MLRIMRLPSLLTGLLLVACTGADVERPASDSAVPMEPDPVSLAQHDRRVDFVEFPSADLAATKRFFAEVFGWKFTDYGPDYTSFEDGRLTGGFYAVPTPPATTAPLVVIYTTDLAGMQQRVEAYGVATFNLHEFPGGRRFHFREPGGNELAVWSDR